MTASTCVRIAASLCVAALLCAAACGACGESGGAAPSAAADAGLDAIIQPDVDAAVDTGPHDAHADSADASWDSCAPANTSTSVPAGWEPWTGWSCECPLYYPGKNGAMPPPIQWEPCQEPLPSGLSCQRMKHFWNESGYAIAAYPKMSLDPSSGAPLLAFARLGTDADPNVDYRIIAEADGPVRNAFLRVNPLNKGCVAGEKSINDGRYAFRMLGDTWDGSLSAPQGPDVEGILAGKIGEFPPGAVLKLPPDPNLLADWAASARWIVQAKDVYTAWSWDLQSTHTVYEPSQDPDHLPGSTMFPIRDEVLVQVGDGLPAGVMTWNEQDGIRPLIRWYGDATQGAGNFGTDGKDMVWTYVAGKYLGGAMYETMSVMTAPFTTDGTTAMASSRRVRSDVKGFQDNGWTVGCGYAARAPGLGSPLNNALYIVRLSDGVSWMLPGTLDLPRVDWAYAMGFTCQELFAVVASRTSTTNTSRILRIRLDSLGPGTPPD